MTIKTADYTEYVLALVAQLIKDWGGASDTDMDDMQGEALFALVEAKDTYKGGSDFKTFLHTVVRNHLRDWRKAENRYEARNRVCGDMGYAPDYEDKQDPYEYPGFDPPYNR